MVSERRDTRGFVCPPFHQSAVPSAGREGLVGSVVEVGDPTDRKGSLGEERNGDRGRKKDGERGDRRGREDAQVYNQISYVAQKECRVSITTPQPIHLILPSLSPGSGKIPCEKKRPIILACTHRHPPHPSTSLHIPPCRPRPAKKQPRAPGLGSATQAAQSITLSRSVTPGLAGWSQAFSPHP